MTHRISGAMTIGNSTMMNAPSIATRTASGGPSNTTGRIRRRRNSNSSFQSGGASTYEDGGGGSGSGSGAANRQRTKKSLTQLSSSSASSPSPGSDDGTSNDNSGWKTRYLEAEQQVKVLKAELLQARAPSNEKEQHGNRALLLQGKWNSSITPSAIAATRQQRELTDEAVSLRSQVAILEQERDEWHEERSRLVQERDDLLATRERSVDIRALSHLRNDEEMERLRKSNQLYKKKCREMVAEMAILRHSQESKDRPNRKLIESLSSSISIGQTSESSTVEPPPQQSHESTLLTELDMKVNELTTESELLAVTIERQRLEEVREEVLQMLEESENEVSLQIEKVASLSSPIQELENQVEKLTQDKEDLTELTSHQAAEISTLKSKTFSSVSVSSVNDKRGAVARSCAAGLKSLANSMTTEEHNLREKTRDFDEQLRAKDAKMKKLEMANTDLTVQLDHLMTVILALSESNDELKEEIAVINKEKVLPSANTSTTNTKEKASNFKMSALDFEKENLLNLTSNLKQRIKNDLTKINELESINCTLTAEMERVSSSDSILDEKLLPINNRIFAAMDENKETKIAFDALSYEFEALSQSKTHLENRINQKDSTIADMELKYDVLVAEMETLFSKCASLEESKEFKVSELETSMKNMADKIQGYSSANLELQETLSLKDQSLSEKKKITDEMKSNILKLEAKIEDMVYSNSALCNKCKPVENLESKLETLTFEKKSLQDVVSSNEKSVKENELRIADLSSKLSEMKAKYSDLSVQYENILTSKKEFEDSLFALETQRERVIKELETRIEETNCENAVLLNRLNRAEADISWKCSTITDLGDTVASLESKLQEQHAETFNLLENLEVAERREQELLFEVSDLRKDAFKKREETARFQLEAEAVLSQYHEDRRVRENEGQVHREIVNSLKETIANLEARESSLSMELKDVVSSLETQAHDLEDQLRDLTNSNANLEASNKSLSDQVATRDVKLDLARKALDELESDLFCIDSNAVVLRSVNRAIRDRWEELERSSQKSASWAPNMEDKSVNLLKTHPLAVSSNKELELTLGRQYSRIAELENEISAAKIDSAKRMEKNETFSAENKQLELTVSTMASTIEDFEAKVLGLLEENSIVVSKCAALEMDLSGKNSRIVELAGTVKEMESKLEVAEEKLVDISKELDNLSMSKTALQDNLTSKDTMITEMNMKISSLNSEHSCSLTEHLSLSTEKKKLEDTLTEKESLIVCLKSEVEEISGKRKAVEAEASRMETKITELDGKMKVINKNFVVISGEYESLSIRNKELEAKEKEIETNVQTLQKQYDFVNGKYESFSTRNREIESDLAIKESKIKELDSALYASERQHQTVIGECESVSTRLKEVETCLVGKDEKIRHLNAEILALSTKHAARAAEMESEIESLKAQNETLFTSEKHLGDTCSEKENTILTLNARLVDVNKSLVVKSEEYEKKTKDLQESLLEKESIIAAFETNMLSLATKCESLLTSKKELEDLELDNIELMAKLKATETDLSAKAETVRDLKSSMKTLSHKNDDLILSKEKLEHNMIIKEEALTANETKMSDLSEEILDLKGQHELALVSIVNLKDTILQKESLLTDLNSKFEALRRENEGLQSALDDNGALPSRVAYMDSQSRSKDEMMSELVSRVTQLDEEIEQLRQSNQILKSTEMSLNDLVSEKEHTLREQTASISKLESTITVFDAQVLAISEENKDALASKIELENTLTELEAERSALAMKYDSLVEEYGILSRFKEEHNDTIVKKENVIMELRRQLEYASADQESATKNIATLSDKNTVLLSRISTMEADLSSKEASILELLETTQRVKDANKRLSLSKKSLEDTILPEMEARITEMKSLQTDMEAKFVGMVDERKNMTAEKEKLNDVLTSQTSDIHKLTAKIDGLEAKSVVAVKENKILSIKNLHLENAISEKDSTISSLKTQIQEARESQKLLEEETYKGSAALIELEGSATTSKVLQLESQNNSLSGAHKCTSTTESNQQVTETETALAIADYESKIAALEEVIKDKNERLHRVKEVFEGLKVELRSRVSSLEIQLQLTMGQDVELKKQLDEQTEKAKTVQRELDGALSQIESDAAAREGLEEKLKESSTILQSKLKAIAKLKSKVAELERPFSEVDVTHRAFSAAQDDVISTLHSVSDEKESTATLKKSADDESAKTNDLLATAAKAISGFEMTLDRFDEARKPKVASQKTTVSESSCTGSSTSGSQNSAKRTRRYIARSNSSRKAPHGAHGINMTGEVSGRTMN